MTLKRTAFYAILIAWTFWVDAAHSQPLSSSDRYPWDARPNKCFAPDVEPIWVCQENNWPDFSTTVSRVQSLLMVGQADQETALLNKAGIDLALGSQKFSTGQYQFEAWYLANESQLSIVDGDVLSFVEGWRQSAGAASPALLVNVIALIKQAWQGRGGGYANTVSAEAWDIFYKKLSEADALLDSASSEVKRSGPWHILKVKLAFTQRVSPSRRLDILKAAIAAWPDSTALYDTPMRMSSPVWGGSFEQMDAIARTAAQASKSRSSAAMYAIVYERAFSYSSRYLLSSTKIDWNLAKQGFRDIEQSGQFPPWIWENFANLACQMRDRDEARRLYALNDVQTEGSESQKNTDPCRAFANEN